MKQWLRISEEKRKWWILGAMTTAISMVFIDVTVLPVTLPTISRELNFSDLGLQWIINAYTLALTVLVLAGGKLAHRLGLKRIFCFGICLFACASAMCGLGNTEGWLIMSRIIQGAGGALMLPATQAIIVHSFPIHQRGKAFGTFISVGSVFLSLGPLIGGYFTEFASWRYVFWINLPIAAAGLALTLCTVPPFPGQKSPFDLLGFLTNLIGISGIVIGIMQAQDWGWDSPLTLLSLSLGIILVALMIYKERNKPFPLIDVALIRNRSIFPCLTTLGTMQFLIMVTVFWAIFFQTISGYTPAQAGIITFMANIPVLIAAPLAGMSVDKFGPKWPVCIGFTLVLLSIVSFACVVTTATMLTLLPSILCFGMGVPFVLTPSSTTILNAAPTEKRAAASGLLIASRQLSATVGLAIFGTLYSHWTNWHFALSVQAQHVASPLDARRFEGLLAHNPNALSALQELPPQTATIVQSSFREASISGFYLINGTAAAIAFLGLIFALKIIKSKQKADVQPK